MKAELARRESNTDRVLALFQSRPLEWLTPREIAAVGGFSAWRSRVADARALAEQDGFTIEWNHEIATSAYRYRPVKLGRDPQVPTAELRPIPVTLFDLGGYR